MKVAILGCSADSISIVFDLLNELCGLERFEIVLNKEYGVHPHLHLLAYPYEMSLVDEYDGKANQFFVFGTATPKVKAAVFRDFHELKQIQKSTMLKVVHPTAYIAPSVKIEAGVLIEPHVVISSQSAIGFGVNIKRGSCIGHHNIIGDYCDINPGSILSGKVTVGKGTIIGTGAVVKDNIHIGNNCIIGIGSVVTKDIPDNSIAYGNPCRVMKQNEIWNI
jgi:sugar O-acyltransferase (sialic acid O-acetyltransferase NeuD family)